MARNNDLMGELKNVSRDLRSGIEYISNDEKDLFKEMGARFQDLNKGFQSNKESIDKNSDVLKEQLEATEKNSKDLIRELSYGKLVSSVNLLSTKQEKINEENKNLVNQLLAYNKSVKIMGDSIEANSAKSLAMQKDLNDNNKRDFITINSTMIDMRRGLKDGALKNENLLNQLVRVDSKTLEATEKNQKNSKTLLDAVKADMTSEKENTTLENINSNLETNEAVNQKIIALLKNDKEPREKKEKKDKKDYSPSGFLVNLLNSIGTLTGVGGIGGLVSPLVSSVKLLKNFIMEMPKLTVNSFNLIKSAATDALAFIKNGGGKVIDVAKAAGGKILDGLKLGGRLISRTASAGGQILSKSGKFLKAGAKFGGKVLGSGLGLGLAAYDASQGFNKAEDIIGTKQPLSNMQITQAGALNAATMNGFLGDPSKLNNWVGNKFDSLLGNTPENNSAPSSDAIRLAATAQNRNVKGKYSGNIQQILRGGRACYSNVWGDIQDAKLSGKINPTGGTHGQNYATDFAEWADTSAGQKKVSRVGVNPADKKKLGLQPGDIVVFQKGWYAGNKEGHIEIVGNDFSGYSDFKDTNLRLVRSNLSKLQGVYRLKGSGVSKNSINSKKKVTGLNKKAYKKSIIKEGSAGSMLQGSGEEKTAKISESKPISVPAQAITPNISDMGSQAIGNNDGDTNGVPDITNAMTDVETPSTPSKIVPEKKNSILDTINGYASKIKDFSNFLPSIESITNSLPDEVKNMIPEGLFGGISKVTDLIPSDLGSVMNNPMDAVKDILPKLSGFLPENLQGIGGNISNILGGSPSNLGDINIKDVSSMLGKAPDILKSLLPEQLTSSPLFNSVSNVASDAISGSDNSFLTKSIKSFITPSNSDINPINKNTEMDKKLLTGSPFVNTQSQVQASQPPITIPIPMASKISAVKSMSVDDFYLAVVTSGVLD
jgi:hypothetical protein